MNAVLRAIAMYILIWIVFRVAGKRTLAETSVFDFVLLLIIAETTQQALIGDDDSLINALLLIFTLVGLDIFASLLKSRFASVDRLLDGQPVLLVHDGQPLREVLRKERVNVDDIVEAARRLQGLERLDQIKYAILERSGSISIIPR